MKKPRLTKVQVSNIVKLRKSGHSISEIGKIVSKGKSTIHHYVKNISVSGKFKVILDKKQNGSRSKQESIRDWSEAKILVREKLGKLTKRDFILIAGMLYWGEGSKTNELNIINSEASLIRVFVNGLEALGVNKGNIRISLRLYSDLNKEDCICYWLSELNLDRSNLVSISYLTGKKSGKLPYGMCRLRVTKAGLYFKQLISIMDYVKMPL
jgi:hypothetical protein